MPSPNFSAYTIQSLSVFGPNVWRYDLYQWNFAPLGSTPPQISRTEVGTTESIHSSYSGPNFNMNPYYGMTQKNGKLYGFAGENNTPTYQWPGQIFEIDQDWGGRTKTIYSGLTGVLPFGFQVCNTGGFAYDKINDCFTLLKGTTQIGVTPPPPPLLPFAPNGERYLHTWGVSHTLATPQLPFYSGVTCLLETVIGLAYKNSELYAVAYISGNTNGLTFQHINTNTGINTIISYSPLSVDLVINSFVSAQGWAGDLTYDEVGDNFYFLSHNGVAKIDSQFYTWEVVPSTATTQQFYGTVSSFENFGFEIIEPIVTTTTTLCTEDYSIEVSPDFLNSTISLCDSGCTNCDIVYVSGCTAPHFGWCTASTTCFDLTLECCKTYCVEILAPDGCSYTEYITSECPSTTTTTTYIPPEPTTTTTTTECVCVYPVEYFTGILSGVTYPGDILEGSYCNDDSSPYIYNHISNPNNSILTNGILIKQTAWGSLPISNNWWSLIRDIGANNYLLVGTGSTLTTVYTGIPPLANDFLVTDGQCECVTTTTTILGFTTTTTTLPGQTTTTTTLPGQTTTTTTLDPCDFGTIPLTGDCPTTTTTTVPPTTTTTTPDPCDFGVIPLTGECVTSTTTPDPNATTTTTTVPCCDECCLITGAWEIINTGTTGNNGFYSIHKTAPHNQTTLPIALKDPTMWGAIPHMFFQGFAKRTTNNFLYGAFLEYKIDYACAILSTSRYDLHIYQINPNTGSGTLAQTYTGYDVPCNPTGIRTDELGEGCLGYDSLNDKLIFIPYNNTVHPVYQIQPWVNGSVTYLGDFTVLGSTPNQYAHMSGLSNIPGTNSFYSYLDECSFAPPSSCSSAGGYVCGFDTTTLNANILPGPINPLSNNSISAGLLYDCEDLYIVRQLSSCSGNTPSQYTNTWIDGYEDRPGECAGNIGPPCAAGAGFNFGTSEVWMAFNEFDTDGNLVSIDKLTGDTSSPFVFTITDPITNTFIGQWEYNILMDGNYPATSSPCTMSGIEVGYYGNPVFTCGGGVSPCVNGLIFTNVFPINNPVVLPETTSGYEIKVEYGGMGTPCAPEYSEIWKDGSFDQPGQIVTQGVYDVGTNGNLPGVGTFKDQIMGEEYMKVLLYDTSQSGQVFNGDNFTASTNNWTFTARHPDGSGVIIGSWEYELVRYPTGPGFPVAICDAQPPVVAGAVGGRCRGGSTPCIAGTPAVSPLLVNTYCFFFKNPVPAGSPIDLSAYGAGSSHFNDIEISWGENTCCSGATDNLVLTKYTLPSGPITNTILGTISGVTALAGLECAGNFCETPDNPCPTTTTTTVPVSTTTTTDPCATSTTTSTTTLGPPTTTTTTPAPSTTTTTTLIVPCECECPPTPPSECPCIFSGTNFYVFYDGSPSLSVSVNQLANNVILPWWQQFIQTLPGYVGCLYQATTPFPTQTTAESWLRFSRYPWEGTNAFTPQPVGVPIAPGVCGSGLDMPIAAALNDPNAVVISFVNESAVMYHDMPWGGFCNAPSGIGNLYPNLACTDWNTNQPNSWNVTAGMQKQVPTLSYLQDFDSFMGTYHNGVWDQPSGTPGNNGSFNSFVYTLPVQLIQAERITELNAYAAVEGRVVPAVDFVDIGMANNGGGLYNFDAIKQSNPYCADACSWNSGYGPGKTPEGRCVSGLTHFGFISVHSHEYLLSNWLGTPQNNNIGIATLSATVCFHTACTSGITVEECCITGLTAEQWVVDNPGVVSGLVIGETFNDFDHNACYKIIPPPIPLPANGITLNPQSPTFGIDNCGECMAYHEYCQPTTTTTTKLYRTTTTTSTTFRQIYGVERCCCPTGETQTQILDQTAATPINFDSSLSKPYVTVDNFVNIGGDVKPPTQTPSSNTNVDITLHFFEICNGSTTTYGNSQAPVMAPVFIDSSTGYLFDLPNPPNSQDLAALQQWEANSLAFYNHVGAPNPGDTLEIRHIAGPCQQSNYDYIECIKYLGPTTEQYPTAAGFQVMNTVCGTIMEWYCQYWIGFSGDLWTGCCDPNPVPCTGTFSYTVLNVHNICADCRGVVATRTFHIWEECVENSYLPLSTSFPPGMCITHEGLPGAIVTGPADYSTAAGLDDVEHNSTVFYNWASSPAVGQVIAIFEPPPGTIFNNHTLCLKYMGTVTTSDIPWFQPGWHMSASVLWGLNPSLQNEFECCVCANIQELPYPGYTGSTNSAPQIKSLPILPGLVGALGNQHNYLNKKIPVGETGTFIQSTYGAPNQFGGWNAVNYNGLAYLGKVWRKVSGDCEPTMDITACAYIAPSEFLPGNSLANFVGVNAPQVGDFINIYDYATAWPSGLYGSHCVEIIDIIDQITYNTGTVKCPGDFGGMYNNNIVGYTPCPCIVPANVCQTLYVGSQAGTPGVPGSLGTTYAIGGVIPLSARFSDCQTCISLTPTQDCGCTDPLATNFVNQFGSYALTPCNSTGNPADDNDCCTYTDSGCWDNNAWNHCRNCTKDCAGVPHNNTIYQNTDTSCCTYTCPTPLPAHTWDCVDVNWQWETPGGGLITPWGTSTNYKCLLRLDGSGQYSSLQDCSMSCNTGGPIPDTPWEDLYIKPKPDNDGNKAYKYDVDGMSMASTLMITPTPPSHMWETCWVEETDYIPNLISLLGFVGKTWGIEYYASPNYIGSACYDFTTNPSSTPSPNFIANSNDFYQYMGAPSIGETVRLCYWHDGVDFNTFTSNNQPTRIPGMACGCLRYMGVGIPDFYDHLRCEVASSNMGTTCSDCDLTTPVSFGGNLADKGITWDNVITNTGLNSCCCNDDYNTGVDCMPPRTFPNPCSGFTYTDLSAIPIGGTWYDATSGECFTHIADPGLTYFDFTAPVPNPGGPYLDCEDCHDMNEIICDPTTTTTTRPREVWGIKPCCCDEEDMVGTVPNIGDTGESGGIIFHVDSINNTIYEVAPKSTEIGGWGVRWGCWGTDVLTNPTLGTAIGMGKTNTNEIFATSCPDPVSWKPYLQSLTVTTPTGIQYNDFFAPSYNEWLKLWFNIGPGQSTSSPLYNLADLDELKPFSGSTPQPPMWITSSENPNNPTYDTINIGIDGASQVSNGLNWYNDMGDLQKNFPFFWLRPIRSYTYQTCSGFTTTDISTIPVGNTWFDPLSGQCYERITYPGPTNYNVNVPLNGPYEDCECCEITHKIVDDCVTTTTTIWDPPKTTTTTTIRPTTTTTTRPPICYGIKPCCCITGETWSIGSTGPGGGVVFYHDGDGNYLEMAPNDINLSNYSLPQNIIAANTTDSAHTFTMWGCMNQPILAPDGLGLKGRDSGKYVGTSREIFAGESNTLLINKACTPDTYGYPCCPSCTTDVNVGRTNPCSGNSIPFTYDLTPQVEGFEDGAGGFNYTKRYIGTDEWPNPGSNLEASNITLHSAAHICATFSAGGYYDWYLPSIKEMNEMYNGLVSATGGQTIGLENPLVAGPPNETFYSTYNFAEGGLYWTSSDCDASRAEYFPMFNAFNNMYLSLGISDGPNYPTGNPCSGKDSMFPELFTSELHSKSVIPYPDTNNNIIQGSPKYVRPVRKFTSSNRYCSGCTKTDLSFMTIGQVFYDVGTNMCWERIAIPGPDLYNISVVPTLFYEDCESAGQCLDTHNIICTTTTAPPTTTTTTAWASTTTTTTQPTTTTTTTCQGISACCTTNSTIFARWCGDSNNPASALSSFGTFYDTLTNECWETIDLEMGPVISINYPPIPLYSCDACEIPCTTTTTRQCLPLSLSACCPDQVTLPLVLTLTADCNTITTPGPSGLWDQTDIYEGEGVLATIGGIDACYVVVPHQPSAPVVAAGFQYGFWCAPSPTQPCLCSGCTDTNYSWSVPCPTTTTTTTERCDNCICLSGVSHLEILYTGHTTSDMDDICLASADGTYCLEETIGTGVSTWIYTNQNNTPGLGYYQIVPFQYVNTPPWEIVSWVVQWCDNPSCIGGNNPYQIATASTIVNTSIPASNPAWDLGQTVWEYIDNQVGPISVNPRNLSVQDPCYNYSGTSHTGCCTSYALLTCCYDPLNPSWGDEMCCNKTQQWFNTVHDIPSLVSGTTGNPSIVPNNVIHEACTNSCLRIIDEDVHTYPPVLGAPMLTLSSIDMIWTNDNNYGCLICEEMFQPCDCPTTTTTTRPATTTTTTGPVTTTTTSLGPLGLEDCCDPTFQYVATGALYITLAGMNVGDAFYGTILPDDRTGCWLIINNPVGPVQTNMTSPSFVSSSCAALNTATNYQLCCPVPTTTTTTYPATTTTTTYGPTQGVRNCCPPYVEYVATGVILTWLQTNLTFGDVVFGNVITSPFSIQPGCWEYVSNVTGSLVSVSIAPTSNYLLLDYPDPCSACTTSNETAACTTTTTTVGLIGIESCCYDPNTGGFTQYVAAGAFATYLNGLNLGQAFEITFNIPGVGDISGCYKVIPNPLGITVSTFVTPALVYNSCYDLDSSINFTCCEQPTTTTTTTVVEIITIRHCCTGDVYQLVGGSAVSQVAGLNHNDTFRLVVSSGQFAGMACCFHKCVGCTPIVGTIAGIFLFPIWAAGATDQCDACETFGQSDGCCPTTTTTTMSRPGEIGLEACCPDPITGLYTQYVPILGLLSDVTGLSLGSAHLFVLNGDPVCAKVINLPVGPNITGSLVLSPPIDENCHGLQLWLPYQNQDPTLRIPCCPVTTTTTCTPI